MERSVLQRLDDFKSIANNLKPHSINAETSVRQLQQLKQKQEQAQQDEMNEQHHECSQLLQEKDQMTANLEDLRVECEQVNKVTN